MFRFNDVKLCFFIAIFFIFFIGLNVSAKEPMDDEDMSIDMEDDIQKFSIPSPFSGRELESFVNSGEYISGLASEVLYIQKASVAISAEANETKFIQRQVSHMFENTNSILFPSIVIAQLFPELYLDALNFSDTLVSQKLVKLQESVVKTEGLKLSIDVLSEKHLILIDFLKKAQEIVAKQSQLLEKYIAKLEKMPTNAFSSRIREKCLNILDRMRGQYSKIIILANQLLVQVNTSYVHIVFLNKQLFENTPQGALQAVIASNLAKCRRSLKFSIYQTKKYITESENCYEGCDQDVVNFREELAYLAKTLDVNRFNVNQEISRNGKLLFLNVATDKEVCGIFKTLDDLFYAITANESNKGRVEFEDYVHSLISIPLDFVDLMKKQVLFTESIADDVTEVQKTDESEEIDSKLDK